MTMLCEEFCRVISLPDGPRCGKPVFDRGLCVEHYAEWLEDLKVDSCTRFDIYLKD